MKKITVLIMTIITSLVMNAADFTISGYLENNLSTRYEKSDYAADELILSETGARLDILGYLENGAELTIKADLTSDRIDNETDLSIKEAYVWIMPKDNLEIKAGRQVLTWGTGDLMFINDQFPKDYKSFFYGRNIDAMKAPSDAVKFSFFPEGMIVDLVLIPSFTPNEYIDGDRFTYYNPMASSFVSTGNVNSASLPDQSLDNMEIAGRIKKRIKDTEFALYGYRGFHKDPNMKSDYSGMEFSRMQVFGGSAVGNLAGGIYNFEFGYENSVDDEDGDKGTIPNSYLKAILGYKREFTGDISLGVQYQIEHMMDYDEYKDSMPIGYQYLSDENRGLASLRVSKLLKQQTVRAEIFTYYSPSDEDGYINPNVDYDVTDGVKLSTGGNIFYGSKDHTFLGQLEDNSNLYFRARYSF